MFCLTLCQVSSEVKAGYLQNIFKNTQNSTFYLLYLFVIDIQDQHFFSMERVYIRPFISTSVHNMSFIDIVKPEMGSSVTSSPWNNDFI